MIELFRELPLIVVSDKAKQWEAWGRIVKIPKIPSDRRVMKAGFKVIKKIYKEYITMYEITEHSHDMRIWQAIVNFISRAVASRHKNLLIRIDLTYPEDTLYPNDNQRLTRFLDSLKHHCDRRGLGLLYFWVREESANSDTATHHYHLFLLLNGREIQNPYLILEKATDLWGKALGCDAAGLVHYCTHNNYLHPSPYAIQIRRTSPDFDTVMEEACGWVQYLAKLDSKEAYLGRTRPFAHSQI